MDRFQALQVFTKVAETGGFASAARDLRLSSPSVTRIVSSLEEHLGVPLFVRTTRSVRLTEAGTRFLLDANRLIADLHEAEELVTGLHGPLKGELRITAPVLFGGQYVTPIIGAFMDENTSVTAQTLFVDRIVNLIEEGLDVGIRIGELTDSSLMAARVGTVRRVTCAAPAYLARAGVPTHPTELNNFELIDVTPDGNSHRWNFQNAGEPVSVRTSPRLRLNTNDAARDQAARGWGITRLLSYQVASQIADGTLVAVLEEFEPPSQPVHVVHQEGRMVSRKVRAFVDFVVDRLRADPTLN